MDPKQNPNQPLDPKLQEVYDRVMGVKPGDTSTPPASNTATTPQDTTPNLSATPAPADGALVISLPGMSPMPAAGQTTAPAISLSNPVDLTATPQPAMPPINPLPSPSSSPTTVVPPTDDNPTPTDNPPGNLTPINQPTMPDATPTKDPMDAMNATMAMPQVTPHDTQTIQIGMGGNPVSVAAKPKGKGISPAILIFGAFAFLVVYAVFWIKFFGYNLPFLSQ